MTRLNFLFKAPSLSFRVVKRKGELRYIASSRRGSLGAMTRFAPPTKPLPKLVLSLASIIDFRLPRFLKWAEPLAVSEDFLRQVAAQLNIPVDRVGIYVGEPNDRRKLVVTDVDGESRWVLKMAVGSAALEAIRNERKALGAAAGARCLDLGTSTQSLEARTLNLSAPSVREAGLICGREAILIERIQGQQLTLEEFEAAFFAAGTGGGALGTGGATKEISHGDTEGTETISVGDWINQNLKPNAYSLEPLLAACRKTGALSLSSSLGIVHGDFAPWNVIRRKADEGAIHQAFGVGVGKENLAPSAPCPEPSALVAIDWEFSRAETPLIFDTAYAAWCYSELLGRTVSSIDSNLWKQHVALGALWKELRGMLGANS